MRIRAVSRILRHGAMNWSSPAAPTQLVFAGAKLFMSDGGSGGGGGGEMKHVGWEEMQKLVNDYEVKGREQSKMIVLDVRNVDEIQETGALSPAVINLPLPKIQEHDVWSLPDEEFESVCGFAKPCKDETIVVSCKAGGRSLAAATMASEHGFKNVINYTGGANEWFSKK